VYQSDIRAAPVPFESFRRTASRAGGVTLGAPDVTGSLQTATDAIEHREIWLRVLENLLPLKAPVWSNARSSSGITDSRVSDSQ
jgi:hypothetical protein